jgi:hypothetical protein
MLHACFTPFASCFVYTSWCFYAFYGTNLLTRCHSASSLFSAIFVFQKSYTGNILGIGRNEAQTSYFPGHETKTEGEPEGGQGPATSGGGAPPLGRTRGWCGAPVHPLTPPLRLYKAFRSKNPKSFGNFLEEVSQLCRHHR